jgi:hypothetical protein
MFRKVMFIILSVIGFATCDSKIEIVYSYKDIIIKRVDSSGKTVFYYNEIGKDSPIIWVEYSGINDGFSGYLKFEENGKVYLLSGDGYFQSSNLDTLKFEFKRLFGHQSLVLDSSVYQIQLSTRYEKERNLNTETKVEVIYGD